MGNVVQILEAKSGGVPEVSELGGYKQMGFITGKQVSSEEVDKY